MIRLVFYITFLVFGVTSSSAQLKSEEIVIYNQTIQLPGTLTYAQEKSPLVIWVHGSGNVDRNGNQKPSVNANYIKQFRDSITKKGIAFFSYDKRTANASNMPFMKEQGVIIKDFVADVQEVVNHFKDDKRFTEIILIGHSQGSLIAMLALENVDKYISLAGAGESIDKIIVKQISQNNPSLEEATKQHFDSLRIKGKIDNVNPFLASLFAKPNQEFLKSWMLLNPVDEIKKVTIPTLIINGDKDLQVKVEDAKSLKEAKPDVEIVIVKNMNHVLKEIEKNEDNLKSYMTGDYPISKELITTIINFIKKTK